MAGISDKVQIGLTPAGDEALESIMALDLFAAEGDAFKLAIAYALAHSLDYESAPSGGYGTKFHASGGVDRDGSVRDLVLTLRPEYADRPYAAAERYAELGLVDIADRLSKHESLADILGE